MILDEFIRSGAYSRHLNKTKALYKIKRETIIKELSNINDIIIDKDNGYLSLIIEIPTLDKDIFIKKRVVLFLH